MPKIHSKHFYKYFICPHWIWHDIYEDKEKHKHIPPLLNILYEGKIKNEKGVIKKWEFSEIDRGLYKDLDEAFLATLELMKQGKNIYRGVLLYEDWVGEPDFLEARPISELGVSKSNFGDFYYVVYDIRNDPELKNEFKFPLIFSSLILERIQGVMAHDAYFVNPHGETTSFLIEPFLQEFQLNLNSIKKILEGEKPPPFLKSGCKRTPWYSVCESGTKGCDDISLIYRLSPADQRRFYELGIKTVTQFVKENVNQLREKLPDWYFDKLINFQNQARTLISSEPLIIKRPQLPKVKKEIYFDVESDPTIGIDYLLGFLIKDGAVSNKARYEYFFAKDKSEEKDIWNKFLKFLSELEDFVIYYYGYYENHVLNRLHRQYGGSYDLLKKFRENSIDLHKIVIDSVVLPLYFYSLKDVAGYIGFKWAVAGAGGAESVLWYDEWVRTGNKNLFDKLIQYNEDDVRATLFVKEWLEKQRPKVIKEKLTLPE